MIGNTIFHSHKVKKIKEEFEAGRIIVDDSYQRRSVWMKRDKVRLIETILNSYLIPPLYFWDAETDPATGDTTTHVVDGQQRISSLMEFIEDSFRVEKKFLLLSEDEHDYQDKLFSELSDEDRLKIWNYELPSIDINLKVTREEIGTIFTRLNLTEYSLNDQERRHSGKHGQFADAVIEISGMGFWDDHALFNAGDLRRMGDLQFCGSLLLMARSGIVDQTTQKALNEAYDDYAEEYAEVEDDKQRVLNWMNTVAEFIDDTTIGFIRKKSQLYSMFCVAESIESTGHNLTPKDIETFHRYVLNYNRFKNDGSESDIDDDFLDLIRQHRQASSEGIHKIKNRVIRFESMWQAIFNEPFDHR